MSFLFAYPWLPNLELNGAFILDSQVEPWMLKRFKRCNPLVWINDKYLSQQVNEKPPEREVAKVYQMPVILEVVPQRVVKVNVQPDSLANE